MKLDTDSLSHTTWNCKYHIVFAPKYRRQVIYGKRKAIQQYIKNQLQEDIASDQINLQEYIDPFTGEPIKKG